MLIDLKEKVAIITGVARGIGKEIFLMLANEGVKTVGLDRNAADITALESEIARKNWDYKTVVCDIRNSEEIAKAVQDTLEHYGRIDILVNNAGISGDGLIENLPENEWDFCHEVNLKGTFLMCKAVIPTMKKQKFGRIINAASFAAIIPSIGSAAYASAKAGVVQFTRVLAGELGPWNITVNSYAPGMIPSTLNHFKELPDERQNQLLDTLTIRRWGEEKDIANLICFLASDAASYITGTLIDCSGGKYATQFPSVAYT
ncbi:SDR family oxidoreductase [Caldibacillus lycopersici]|uniref:SDR family oxidoreductase n=1 Tax=Perspicuibacillus lycopersici TaxID=1325689 RepID=A0AAE3LMY8_9BACI|nr:SDR family NAD(P)-dependent oxidoreductase [Perspicuibacillus lycopersici]MCU9613287.1 SDR family oxidoreductase [Perspicuibacillus lycopersici]